MSGSKSIPVSVQLKSVEVPKCMQEGEKFIKWDEDSGQGTPVTLKVDENAFYLYWIDQNKEMDLLDIATMRDIRTGKQAKIPKDPKLRHIVSMGSQDTLEEKTVTICCGSDFVNLSFINFCCTKKEIAQPDPVVNEVMESFARYKVDALWRAWHADKHRILLYSVRKAKLWTDELLKLAYSLVQLNSSAIRFLQKAHTKLLLSLDKSGKIPIKNIVKLFAQNKEDRKRVEKALDVSGFPSAKNDALSPQKFMFEEFFTFYKNLTQRAEVEKIFEELCGSSKRKLMTAAQLVDFLNKTQRDPRLNEILHPYANTVRAKDLISQYEPNKYNAQRGQLSLDGFLRYLMSEDNPVIATSKVALSDDMDQPLAHYFINSSHNTYLTGHQLTGKSSVEIYRQCLLAGCRCVELDFWNGRTEEPVIVHGYTFVPDISAREVIEAIADSAFKTSDYPVVLSFENHCNPRQQAKIAQYCHDIFGDMLLDQPLDSYKLEPGVSLPPPALLKRKIIIKNKKKHHHHHHHHHKKMHSTDSMTTGEGDRGISDIGNDLSVTGNGEVPHPHNPPVVRQGSKESNPDEEENDDEDEDSSSGGGDDDDDTTTGDSKMLSPQDKSDKAVATKETEAGAEISALVNYVQPVHFTSFENAEKRNKFYEMSSFDEKQATSLLKERPIEFVNYNKHQLSRIYPAGTRFDSSNFMPQVFWNAGCQLVALNYQTLDLAMQLNLGIFEYNHRCGYLLKPEFMRRQDRRFDPFAESTVDGIIAGTVSIHVLSAQFLTDKRTGVYVEVDMFGLPADTVRKKFRTRIISNNGINPNFDDEPFVFKKVVLPEIACLRIAAYEEGGRLLGHRVLPVVGLCPGYRHVSLRTECGQPLPLATLFLHVVVKDYVPDGLSDFAEALANPIKFQSELEKRAQQLSVLTDDMEVDSVCDGSNASGPTPTTGACGIIKAGKRLQSSLPDLTPAVTGVSPGGHRLSISPIPSSAISPILGITGSSSNTTETDQSESNSSDTLNVVPSVSAVTTTSATAGDVASVSLNKSPPKANASQPSSTTTAVPTPSLSDELVAESLEKIMENKLVKEKKVELDKKLETLRRKHEKERNRAHSQDGDKSKGKFHLSNRLVKRLSSKNISEVVAETSESSECESDNLPRLPRSQSERLLAVYREHICQERELREKYHELMFTAADKVLRASQANQMSKLRALLEKETADVMRRLQAVRRSEVKELSKQHKDKDEVMRMKREVASSIVEKGVNERMRLTQIYEKKREQLEHHHQEIRAQLVNERSKAKSKLCHEYENRYARVDEEIEDNKVKTAN